MTWFRALGERLGCSPILAAQITQSASGQSVLTEKEKEAFGNAGKQEFVDVSSGLSGRGMPKIYVDGPFGKFRHSSWSVRGTDAV